MIAGRLPDAPRGAVRLALLALALVTAVPAQRFAGARPADPAFFPLAVWLQSPHNALRYRDIGVNLYVGLYKGPTEAQLKALDDAGMPVICHQNDVGLSWPEDTIVGWMHGDEPDNAQPKQGAGYGPPIAPAEIVKGYQRMRQRDARRPVLLNLGQGVAWDGWRGRGVRTNHPEDYPEYAKGCDIASFDIYPVTHRDDDVRGKLEFVGRGVRRLHGWTGGDKPVWACIETTHIHSEHARPTPTQVRQEVWQAIACGADGIIYFAHEFAPKFVEAGLLAHDDVRAAVAAINREVAALAPVLNSEELPDAVRVATGSDAEIVVRAHRHAGALHLLVASLSSEPCEARLTLRGQRARNVAVRDGEQTTRAKLQQGAFSLALEGYGVRHVRVTR